MRRVKPYYLYQCDPITGSSHFRTPVSKGLEIIEGLRGHTTGYAVPQFVIDAPGGGGKIPLLPDYLVGRDGDDVLIRNFEGGIYRYPDPGGAPAPTGSPTAERATSRPEMLTVGLVYDLRDEYRAMGYSDEETAEFDSARPSTRSRRRWAASVMPSFVSAMGASSPAGWSPGSDTISSFRLPRGSRVARARHRCRRCASCSSSLMLFSDPADHGGDARQGRRQAHRPRWRHADRPVPRIRPGGTGNVGWQHFPAFVKPLAEGTGKGCEKASMVSDAAGLRAAAEGILARYGQPALIEAYLPGREFTVGIIGTGDTARVVGVMEIVLLTAAGAEQGVYSYLNKEECERLVEYRAAQDGEAMQAAEHALAAHRASVAAVMPPLDPRSDAAGVPVFLEVNPIAGLHPSHSDLPILAGLHAMAYDELIAAILASASERYGGVAANAVSGDAAASRSAAAE